MKVRHHILLLLCVLFATAAATTKAANAAPSKFDTKQTQDLLRAFYVEYCTLIAGSGDSRAAEQRLLDAHLTRQVLRKMDKLDYMALIRAQDFNAKDLETVTVTHVDADWYAAAYFYSFGKSCVIVPVKAVVENGMLRITDITLP